MDFLEFQAARRRDDFHYTQHLKAHLWAEAQKLREDFSHERLYLLAHEIADILEGPAEITCDLMETLGGVADEILDNTGERNTLHTSLRHIAQSVDGRYEGRVQDKLNETFNRFGIMEFDLSQFYHFERSGAISLNSWGRFALERLDDRQLIEAHTISHGKMGRPVIVPENAG